MAARSYETEALVVRTIHYGETSQVVHLVTPEHGRVTAMAKGSHRPGADFQGGVPLGTLGTATLRPRKGAELELLTRYRWQHTLRGLTDDTERYFAGLYVLDLARTWMQPALPMPALYQAARTTLRALAKAPKDRLAGWVVWFEARALAATGHRPVLEACVTCGHGGPEPMRFVPALGGIAHDRCRGEHTGMPLSGVALEGLRRLYTARIGELAAEPLTDRRIQEARRIHDAFVPYVLERRPATMPHLLRHAFTKVSDT